jgi:hypothetical protein
MTQLLNGFDIYKNYINENELIIYKQYLNTNRNIDLLIQDKNNILCILANKLYHNILFGASKHNDLYKYNKATNVYSGYNTNINTKYIIYLILEDTSIIFSRPEFNNINIDFKAGMIIQLSGDANHCWNYEFSTNCKVLLFYNNLEPKISNYTPKIRYQTRINNYDYTAPCIIKTNTTRRPAISG